MNKIILDDSFLYLLHQGGIANMAGINTQMLSSGGGGAGVSSQDQEKVNEQDFFSRVCFPPPTDILYSPDIDGILRQ